MDNIHHPWGSEGPFISKDICTAFRQFLPRFLVKSLQQRQQVVATSQVQLPETEVWSPKGQAVAGIHHLSTAHNTVALFSSLVVYLCPACSFCFSVFEDHPVWAVLLYLSLPSSASQPQQLALPYLQISHEKSQVAAPPSILLLCHSACTASYWRQGKSPSIWLHATLEFRQPWRMLYL